MRWDAAISGFYVRTAASSPLPGRSCYDDHHDFTTPIPAWQIFSPANRNNGRRRAQTRRRRCRMHCFRARCFLSQLRGCLRSGGDPLFPPAGRRGLPGHPGRAVHRLRRLRNRLSGQRDHAGRTDREPLRNYSSSSVPGFLKPLGSLCAMPWWQSMQVCPAAFASMCFL